MFKSDVGFAINLVNNLFEAENGHEEFRRFLSADWNDLKRLSKNCHSADAVETLLNFISDAFGNENNGL